MSDDFKRQGSHKRKKVPSSWRRPRGIHSPQRKGEKHAAPAPKPGYRSPVDERGKHPSGYDEVLIHTPTELEEMDPETEAARVGSSVGGRKRESISEKAEELDIKLLNVTEDDN
ncbi:MAG: 50S ribosomal protein L32e [Candidatus Nanohaloarchaeota archaeon QJJ-7]|nr:50S ribosomal protein L32e [Candidatus Nanohaloarchaeota archaeon QJJ-7]